MMRWLAAGLPTGLSAGLPGGLLAPPLVRLVGPHCVLRPAAAADWREWAALRAESRDFLTPWEPAWPPDALSRTAFVRRLKRQAQEWRGDEAYSFFIFQRNDSDGPDSGQDGGQGRGQDRGPDRNSAYGRLVGGLGLTNVRRGVAQAGMLGYWVGARYARRGYGGAAVRLLLEFAFRRLALHRVEAACLPGNVASRGLLSKLGFIEEGYARGYLRIDGAWCDHVLYGMLAEDWGGA